MWTGALCIRCREIEMVDIMTSATCRVRNPDDWYQFIIWWRMKHWEIALFHHWHTGLIVMDCTSNVVHAAECEHQKRIKYIICNNNRKRMKNWNAICNASRSINVVDAPEPMAVVFGDDWEEPMEQNKSSGIRNHLLWFFSTTHITHTNSVALYRTEEIILRFSSFSRFNESYSRTRLTRIRFNKYAFSFMWSSLKQTKRRKEEKNSSNRVNRRRLSFLLDKTGKSMLPFLPFEWFHIYPLPKLSFCVCVCVNHILSPISRWGRECNGQRLQFRMLSKCKVWIFEVAIRRNWSELVFFSSE